jgi:hypothetical protein
MEPSSLPPLRSYHDVTVFQLEPLYDPFLARELEQRRFSKTQEGEWITRIARDVQRNERAVRVCLPLRVLLLNAAWFFFF